MSTLITVIACLATLAAAIFTIRRGAGFAKSCYPNRKWAAVCVAAGIMLVAIGLMLILGQGMPGWLRCVEVVVLGFAGGIAARMKQLEEMGG